MIGEGLWKRRFGADQSIIGRTILLNNIPTTVVGIAPASLNLISGGDIYTPLIIDPAKENRLSHLLIVFGKLKPGVSMQQALTEVDTISRHLREQYGANLPAISLGANMRLYRHCRLSHPRSRRYHPPTSCPSCRQLRSPSCQPWSYPSCRRWRV